MEKMNDVRQKTGGQALIFETKYACGFFLSNENFEMSK